MLAMQMNLMEVVNFLQIKNRDIFPVPNLYSIIRLGKIPINETGDRYWFPIWRISQRYNEDQVMTILSSIKKKFNHFAIAFENDDNYLILSDNILDTNLADKILMKIT